MPQPSAKSANEHPDLLTASTQSSRVWKSLRRNPSAWIGGLVLLVVLLLAATANLIAPYGPDDRDTAVGPAARPSAEHWLGTDNNEKDVLSRVMYGSRLSLLAGLFSITLAVSIGATSGAIAGYFGGFVDTIIMRSVDVALSFPSLLIALLVATAFRPGWMTVIVAVGLINVPVFARQIRATVLTVRDLDYVLASRALGAPWHFIMRKAILPAIFGPVLVLATLGLGSAILEVAGLSFLGISGQPTDAEWGTMLAQAKDAWSRNPWFAIGPGAAISITILGFNLAGDALRDALDPRLNSQG